MPGVRAVVTGRTPANCSAGDSAGYAAPWPGTGCGISGEPVALVVAEEAQQAMAAAAAIQVRYSPLSPVTTIEEALVPDPVLVHENLGSYQRMEADIYPRAGTNLFHAVKVRKGGYGARLGPERGRLWRARSTCPSPTTPPWRRGRSAAPSRPAA